MWIGVTALAGVEGSGVSGSVKAFFPAQSEPVRTFALPEAVVGMLPKPSFAKWTRGSHSRVFIAGAFSDNIVVTEHRAVVRSDIYPISMQLVQSSSPAANEIGVDIDSGPGLTGEVIIYLRWRDSLHGRRSPLSNGVTLSPALANESVTISNIPNGPTPADLYADVLEIWASVDGGLPRYIASRNVGADTVTIHENVQGEAETDPTTILPRCTINATYHDRLASAGDDRHPDRLYFSAAGEPEAYQGLWISTRNGEAITGLFVVRDTLVVQCNNIHYYVQGYDETDLSMNILEPFIGGMGHHSVANAGDFAIFPSVNGWYACDGTSLIPISAGTFERTWAKHSQLMSRPWSVFDTQNGLLKCRADGYTSLGYVIPGMPVQTTTYWVLDCRGLLNRTGGVELMFDSGVPDDTAAAMLAYPDGTRSNLYTGDSDGHVYKNNVGFSGGFWQHDDVESDTTADSYIHYMVQTPQIQISTPGDDADCASISKIWLYMLNEDYPVEVTVFAGNQYDWLSAGPNFARGLDSLYYQKDVMTIQEGVESFIPPGWNSDVYRVPRDRVVIYPINSAGSTVSVSLKEEFQGFALYNPLVFRGWGAGVDTRGEEQRSGLYTANGS